MLIIKFIFLKYSMRENMPTLPISLMYMYSFYNYLHIINNNIILYYSFEHGHCFIVIIIKK